MEPTTQQIIDNFSHSTVKTLKSLCKTDVTALKPFLKRSRPNFKFEVAGIIGITSDQTRGSVGIYFPQAVFLTLVSRMFDEKVLKIDRTNEDAAAEMMNIIFGDARVRLTKLGHVFRVSIPSVLRGGQVVTPGSTLHDVTVIPFQLDGGEFCLEFTFIPLKESEKVKKMGVRIVDSSQKAAFFKPFVDCTINSLQIMGGIQSSPGTPSAKKNSESFSFDLAGVIGITSEGLTGSYMVSFKEDVFLKMMSKFLGETYSKIEPGMEDGVAELLNIILGGAKKVLNEQHGHSIQMAFPSVVHGNSVKSNIQVGKTTIVIPFYSDIGRFVIEVVID